MSKKFSMSMPIGETAQGLPSPVFFDPHYAIRTNKPPVSLITGSPGSGKTVASLLLASHAALLNKTGFILDPKGDFLALQLLQNAGEIENVKVWSIFDSLDDSGAVVSEENYGILDPTCLTDNASENVALTMRAIETMVKELGPKQRNRLIPIVQDVANSKAPSMNDIKMILARDKDPEIATLSREIGLMLDMPAGKLLSASPSIRNRLEVDNGIIVASLMGLSLPSSNKSPKSYSEMERVSVAIMQLLIQLVLNSMKKVPKTINKILFIDEAWAIFNNEHGRELIDEVALMGRSLNMAVVLATQSPLHIKGSDGSASLDTAISTRIAFKNTSDIDNKVTVEAMDLPPRGGFEGILKTLAQGQCLIKDTQGQFSFVDILLPSGWLSIFDTTPEAKK